jgi:hypothetical protein
MGSFGKTLPQSAVPLLHFHEVGYLYGVTSKKVNDAVSS